MPQIHSATFWLCNEKGLIKMIPTIPHNLLLTYACVSCQVAFNRESLPLHGSVNGIAHRLCDLSSHTFEFKKLFWQGFRVNLKWDYFLQTAAAACRTESVSLISQHKIEFNRRLSRKLLHIRHVLTWVRPFFIASTAPKLKLKNCLPWRN